MHDLAGLASYIDSRSYVYVCPNAPLPVQLGPGFTGYAWTPLLGEKNSTGCPASRGGGDGFCGGDDANSRGGSGPGVAGGVSLREG